MKRLADMLRIRTRKAPEEVAVDQLRHLPQQLFKLSLEIEPANGQLVFSAAELIELQAAEINRLQQAARDAAERGTQVSELAKSAGPAGESDSAALLRMVKFLHTTLADVFDLLDPRSLTPHDHAVAAHAKAKEALKVAKECGVVS